MVKMATNKENKPTFIYSTLKVEEKKVVLFFQFEAILTSFWPFFSFFCLKFGQFSRKQKIEIEISKKWLCLGFQLFLI